MTFLRSLLNVPRCSLKTTYSSLGLSVPQDLWELFSLQLLDGCVPVLYSFTLFIVAYYSATEGPYANL